MAKRKKTKHHKKSTHIEVVSIGTRKIKTINITEKKVFFDVETNTYQEILPQSSSYDNENKQE
tara:strand:+ start:272 stop:460 length:189 start_codon:yes stop_codon:yes gene_type:complete